MAIEYTDDDRKKDFDFFLSNYDDFYKNMEIVILQLEEIKL